MTQTKERNFDTVSLRPLPGVQLVRAQRVKHTLKIKKVRREEARERLREHLTKGRSGIPGSGIFTQAVSLGLVFGFLFFFSAFSHKSPSGLYSACVTNARLRILVPRAHDPCGLWQGSRALAGTDFLSMRRAFVSYSRPIRFDGKSVNRGLPVLDQARALDPCHRPEGSWALGTRMTLTAHNRSCRREKLLARIP